MSLFIYLGFALLGGLILNVMPCVLPVLTLKAFSVLDHSRSDPRRQRLHGLGYMLGTVSAFALFATLVISARASGRLLGWGMQFQDPRFVAALTAVVFAFALNALGVFEIAVGSSEEHVREGFWGSVLNGAFAAVMATPCSAPFLGSAASFAISSDVAWWSTILVFIAIGIGLALPYTLLALVPGVARMLPRPGAWMETIKQIMGFSLLGTAVWLFSVLQKQVNTDSSSNFLIFLLLLAVLLWGMHKFANPTQGPIRRWSARLIVVISIVFAAKWLVTLSPAQANQTAQRVSSETPVVVDGHINWILYNAQTVEREHQRKRPIFVDFTAEWCAVCKANEKVFLETETVRDAFVRSNVLPMKADLTSEQPEIESLKAKLGRSGIPIYVVYYPDGNYHLLPEIITADLVANALDEAAKKFPTVSKKDI